LLYPQAVLRPGARRSILQLAVPAALLGGSICIVYLVGWEPETGGAWLAVPVALLAMGMMLLAGAVVLNSSRSGGRPMGAGSHTGQAQQTLQATLTRMHRQLHAVGLAGQLDAVINGDVTSAAQRIAELAAEVSGCARVNVWLFNETGTELRCIELYEAPTGRHSSGMVLREPDFQAEFQALRYSRYVDADDPLSDPRTAGYATNYLKPLRITSMLDAVIRVSGRNVGVLCFEHVDRPHHWEQDEISFACQLADTIALTVLAKSRLRSERQLRESESALAEAQSIAHVGSWEYDLRRMVLTWSEETFRIFGADPTTHTPTYVDVLQRTHPDDRDTFDRAFRDSLVHRTSFAIDHRVLLEGGRVRHVHARGRTFYDADGRPIRSVGTVLDITDRKRAEERLQFANTLLTTQMETSPDGVLVVDQTGRITSSNERFAEMFSLPIERVRDGQDAPVLAALTAVMKNPGAFLARVQHLYDHPEEKGHDELETTDGRFLERHTAPLRASDGRSLGRVWYFRDITDRKRAEAEIRHFARHDNLTGLVNRLVFKEAIEQAIARARRTDRRFAVLCLDLDHFKDVNDTLGHPAGDELLQLVASRLRSTCRATDTIARFGGDEFAVVASDISEPADAAVLAGALIRALSTPFLVRDREVRTGGSIGIALCESADDRDPETLLLRADLALYRAKAEGRGTFRFFTEAMDIEVRTRVAMSAQLRAAIESNQLFLLYQPQIEIETGRITGVEALVRWNHPARGVLEPAAFIPTAEKSGLIGSLSLWVLREACRQVRAWVDSGVAPSGIAVNLSALQFKAPAELEREVAMVLDSTQIPPRLLELELTETALMMASRENSDVISRLRARGVRVAIDDFGTGYSSLDYLRRFPVDRIKIPQEFVHQVLLRDGGSAAIVRATLGLARELGISVIAEGVESREQLTVLRSWGCQQVQGFYFSEPLTADALTPLLVQGGLPRRLLDPALVNPPYDRLH
jgi:diguanylate cyclase (GGDEF)-like protein/PAS domain S-box-containing protein